MNDSALIAKRYAEALFNLALKEKNLGEIEKAFTAFVSSVTKNARFVDFMESPVIPHKNKEGFLSKIIPNDMPALLALFLKLILSKKRYELLIAIEQAFRLRAERYRGIHKAELVTAVAMDPAVEKNLVAMLERKLSAADRSAGPKATVNLVSKIDKNLIGGFILKLDKQVVDASYRTKLRELQQALSAAYV